MFDRLQDAMQEVAAKVDKETKYATQPSLAEANTKAMKLLSSGDPLYRDINGRPRNIRFIALFRANVHVRRQGIDWTRVSWELLLEWLYENWTTILKVLMSLLVLI